MENLSPWLGTMPTARLRCRIPGTSNQVQEQPAITGRTDGIPPFYLSTLRPQAAYFNFFFFFSVSEAHLLKFLSNKKYEKKIGPSCVQTTETQMTNLNILQITVPVFWPPLILIRFSSNS